MVKRIAIEGIDGSGKGTQAKKLKGILERMGNKVKLVNFPIYSSESGKKIANYLNSDEEMDNYDLSKLYAKDRSEYHRVHGKEEEDYDFVIYDRYVLSNVYQAAKIDEKEERRRFLDYIFILEYSMIPREDMTLVMGITPELSQKNVLKKEARNYTNDEMDRNEANLGLLVKASAVYNDIANGNDTMYVIDCVSDDGSMKQLDIISDDIMQIIVRRYFSVQ